MMLICVVSMMLCCVIGWFVMFSGWCRMYRFESSSVSGCGVLICVMCCVIIWCRR